MKKSFCCCIVFACTLFFLSSNANAQTKATGYPDFRNFYGICWRGNPHENLAYARQMGYKYVFYQYGMEKDSLSNGMYFYLETPEYMIYDRKLDSKKRYSQQQINFYENYCTLKDTTSDFPDNLAPGWSWQPGSGVFTPILDFRKSFVIQYAVNGIMKIVDKIQAENPNFRFAGFAWDEPRLNGDFWETTKDKKLIAANLEHWLNKRASVNSLKKSLLDYNSYADGHAAFYKQLYQAARSKTLNAHFISEPYDIYHSWIIQIQDRPDAKDISQDILSQESPGTQFIDDPHVHSSGLVDRKNVYCTTPNEFGEQANRILAAKAAVSGENFGWFGRFGGTGDMPDFKSITEVPPRLKLIRMLTNWENINGTPLSQRSWDGTTYRSNTAYVSPDVIAIMQPNTHKLFIVFLTQNGSYTLPANKKATGVSQTSNLFIETANGLNDISIQQKVITPRAPNAINKGYIVTIR